DYSARGQRGKTSRLRNEPSGTFATVFWSLYCRDIPFIVRLFGNLVLWMGPESTDLLRVASRPKGSLSELLLPPGYFRIGCPDIGSFNAICFDMNYRSQNRNAESCSQTRRKFSAIQK